MRRGLLACAFAGVTLLAAAAVAQEPVGRVALEAVASVSLSSATPGNPFVIVDAIGTAHLAGGWDVLVRPWARKVPDGDWSAQLYQLQLRYVSSTRVPFRLDAGVISSPLGLAALELRPDRNPTIGAPSYYFVPLPAFDGRFDRVVLMSGGYPLGAVVTVSGARWDARAGITDGTPARARDVFGENRPPGEPQVIAGGGVTPVQGLRVGAGFARGVYRSRGAQPDGALATVFNLEGEYSVAYTKVSGEWIVDRFENTLSPAVARGFNLVAVQTLSPRWFVAARTTRASSPVMKGVTPGRRSMGTVEGTVGFRLTREITFRAGYQGSRAFGASDWQHAAVASAVWAARWW